MSQPSLTSLCITFVLNADHNTIYYMFYIPSASEHCKLHKDDSHHHWHLTVTPKGCLTNPIWLICWVLSASALPAIRWCDCSLHRIWRCGCKEITPHSVPMNTATVRSPCPDRTFITITIFNTTAVEHVHYRHRAPSGVADAPPRPNWKSHCLQWIGVWG